MYKNHREAFVPKKGDKRPLETNLDNIINQAQIKMKEMISEKMETDKKINLLINQENVLNENISFLKNEINNKKQTMTQMNEKLMEINSKISQLEKDNTKVIKESNAQEAKLKDDMNVINGQLDKIKDGTLPAEAGKVFEIKNKCEEMVNLKDENNKLREKLYILSRRLYSLEVRIIFLIFQMDYHDAINDERISALKAKRGIENIEELFKGITQGDESDKEKEENEHEVKEETKKQTFIYGLFITFKYYN